MSVMREQAVKRLLALATAVGLLMATGVPSMAAENTYTSDGTASVPITATVSSSYTVVLPSTTQTLTDPDNDGTYTGTIKYDVFGKVNSDKALIVVAGDGNNSIGDAVNETGQSYYSVETDFSRQFHMTGTTGGQTVNGMIKHTVLRFFAGGATTAATLDKNIPTAKSDAAPFAAEMSIEIPYTDTFTGNMPFSFGLVDVT